MSKDYLLSVILPCFNVSEYIDRCLESVVGQSIGIANLQIICVDDASTDDTLEKLYKWESKYPDNIMIVSYDENNRQGYARNIGMKYATAEFLSFIDSDDWIEKDMLRDLYEKIVSDNYDMVACKIIRDNGAGIPIEKDRNDKEYFFKTINGFSWADISDSEGNNGTFGGCVAKIFRRQWLINHELWFPERLAYEDNYWMGLLKLYLKKVYVIDKVYYHYWVNPHSTIMKSESSHHFDRLLIEEQLLKKYQELGVFNIYDKQIFINFFQRYYLNSLHVFFYRFSSVTEEIFNYIIDKLYDYYPNINNRLEEITFNGRVKLLVDFLLTHRQVSQQEIDELQKAYIHY